MLNDKSNTLSCMLINGSKNEKKFFLMHFNPGTRNCDLKNGAQDSSLRFFFLNIFYLFDSIFQRWKSCITWWRNLFSQKCLPWKSEKDNFSTIISMIVKNVSSKKKKKKNVADTKSWFDWISTRQDKKTQAGKCTFCDKKQKS